MKNERIHLGDWLFAAACAGVARDRRAFETKLAVDSPARPHKLTDALVLRGESVEESRHNDSAQSVERGTRGGAKEAR